MTKTDEEWFEEFPRFKHGGTNAYAKGCRCTKCTESHALLAFLYRNRNAPLSQRTSTADLEWTVDSACKDMEPGIFFDHEREEEAKGVCGTCPVLKMCLRYAVEYNEYGVWGGTNEKERRTIARRIRRERYLAKAGLTL